MLSCYVIGEESSGLDGLEVSSDVTDCLICETTQCGSLHKGPSKDIPVKPTATCLSKFAEAWGFSINFFFLSQSGLYGRWL